MATDDKAAEARAAIAREDRIFAGKLTVEQLEEAFFDGTIEAADGCIVEPDGRCPHSHVSPLRVLGYI